MAALWIKYRIRWKKFDSWVLTYSFFIIEIPAWPPFKLKKIAVWIPPQPIMVIIHQEQYIMKHKTDLPSNLFVSYNLEGIFAFILNVNHQKGVTQQFFELHKLFIQKIGHNFDKVQFDFINSCLFYMLL